MKRPPDSLFRYFPVSQRDRAWGCHAVTAGVAHIPPRTVYPPAGHPGDHAMNWEQGRVLQEFALVYVASGRGHFQAKGGPRRTLESGSVVMLFPGVWHRYRPDPRTGWTEYWVGFEGTFPRELVRQRFFRPDRPVFKPASEWDISATFQHLVNLARTNPPALQQLMAGATMNLLGQLFSSRQQRTPLARHPDAPVRKALHLVHSERPATGDLAHRVRLSERHLRRAFKQYTGLSPHQYRLHMQLAEARRLLGDRALTIKEIAARCGFADEHYFSRLFKRKTGLTPGAWRNPGAVRVRRGV